MESITRARARAFSSVLDFRVLRFNSKATGVSRRGTHYVVRAYKHVVHVKGEAGSVYFQSRVQPRPAILYISAAHYSKDSTS